jgi:putative Holliday junction resolvase
VTGRLLGIDLGERRVGIAIADGDGSGARPLATLRRGRNLDQDAAAIGRLAAEQGARELIVGLPINASGEEGPQAALTREWGTALAERVGLPLRFRDERLSSHLAQQRLGPMKRGRSGGPPTAAQREVYRSRVDREAAAIILQDELDARAVDDAGGPPGTGTRTEAGPSGWERSP